MARIENLGAYGQLTKAAKAAGGVEKLITNLEATAVSRAAMGLRAQGAVFGVLCVGVVGVVYKLYRCKKRVNVEAQETARAELREIINDEELQQDDDTDN